MVGAQSCPPCPEGSGNALEGGRVGCDKPARPQQSWVQEVRPVGGSNDKHLSAGMEAIELCKELGHNSAGSKTGHLETGKSPTASLSHQWKKEEVRPVAGPFLRLQLLFLFPEEPLHSHPAFSSTASKHVSSLLQTPDSSSEQEEWMGTAGLAEEQRRPRENNPASGYL